MLVGVASVFVFLAIVSGALALLRPAASASDQRMRRIRGGPIDTPQERGPLLKRPGSSIPALQQVLARSARFDRLATDLERANVRLRVGEFILLRVLLALLLFALPLLVSRFNVIGILVGLALGLVGYMLPVLYIGLRQRGRRSAIENQLVDFCPMIASSLRSGFALQQAIELASRQLGPPMSEELGLLIHDINLGANTEAALLDFGSRINSPDVDMLVTAILVQRSSGGNLAEILDQTAETLRERERIRGDLRTLTTQHRLTGMILSIWPALVGLLLLALMPAMWTLMFTDPVGQVMLGLAVGLQVVGFLVMRRAMQIAI